MKNDLFDQAILKKIIHTQSILVQTNFDLLTFMQCVVNEMQSLTPATGAVVELIEGDEMVYRAVTGTVSAHLGLRLQIKNSISGLCISTKEILLANDTEIDPRVNIEACRRVAARSLVVAPLMHGDEPLGVLKIASNKPNGFNELHIQLLQIMAGFIASGLKHQLLYEEKENLLEQKAVVIEKLKKTQQQLAHLAHHDYLTGLANRGFFHESLKKAFNKAKSKGIFLALMYLDIDHFKQINDTLGHEAGDKLLVYFSSRLRQCVRSSDLVVRLGGDEFVILLQNIAQQDIVIAIAKKIINQANKSFKINNHMLKITTSIGITLFNGEDIDSNELLKQADSALYEAKEAGRNQFHLYKKDPTAKPDSEPTSNQS